MRAASEELTLSFQREELAVVMLFGGIAAAMVSDDFGSFARSIALLNNVEGAGGLWNSAATKMERAAELYFRDTMVS